MVNTNVESYSYGDHVQNMRDLLEETLAHYSFNKRRKELEWKQVLDKNKNVLESPKMHRICDMETEHLRSILLDADYEDKTNYDLVLKTIWEEYHYRKNNHLC
jgi:hypothetical protein